MKAFLLFAGWTALLSLEGWALVSLVVPRSPAQERIALSLALGALSNVLLFFLFTLIDVPLRWTTLLAAHALIVVLFLWGKRFRKHEASEDLPTSPTPALFPVRNWDRAICVIYLCLLSITAAFTIVHAVLLPTFQIDSLTNWTMRSKLSFLDQHIAFDTDELRGMSKSQYPFLFHALQILVNEGNSHWNDRSANAILLLVNGSCALSLFFVVRRLRGTTHALLTLTLLFGIPLFSFHLAGGYADIHLTFFLLLALGWLCDGLSRHERSSFILSALMIAASVWTKSEGLVIGLVAWTAVLLLLRKKMPRLHTATALCTAWALSLPWPLFLLTRGLSLTPHATDTRFGWHPEGIVPALQGLFSGGSFGILWYALLCCIGLMIAARTRKHPHVDAAILATLLFGAAAFFLVLATYLLTPNINFLLTGQSFHRQMMIPSSLLLLSCACAWKTARSKV